MSFLPRAQLLVLCLVAVVFWSGCPLGDDDDGHNADDDASTDDDTGDDDSSDDDSGEDCPWQGTYVGGGTWFQKDPWGDFTMWDFEGWGEIDADCVLAGEFDLSYSPVEGPANLEGDVDSKGAAQGIIAGPIYTGEKVTWEWSGNAIGKALQGAWQDKNQYGLYLNGNFSLTESE